MGKPCNRKNVTEEKKTAEKTNIQKRKKEGLSKFWDKMAKEILEKYPELILPFLNTLFGMHYKKGTKIEILNSEHVAKEANGKTHTVQSDLVILVNGQDLYHIEFQRMKDSNISCRFLEYDIEIAIKSGTVRKSLTKADKARGLKKSTEFLHTRPLSVLVNLTHAIQEPDIYESSIKDGKGNEWIYTIQVINVQKLKMEEIESLGYDLLIPFLPIKVWEKFSNRKQTEKNTKDAINKLVAILKKSRDILQNRDEGYYISPGASRELWESLLEACDHLFREYPIVLEEAGKYMGDDFYFWDERLEMEKKKVAFLEERERNLQTKNENLQIQNENLQIQNEDLQKALKKKEMELEMERRDRHRFLRFMRNWKNFMF